MENEFKISRMGEGFKSKNKGRPGTLIRAESDLANALVENDGIRESLNELDKISIKFFEGRISKEEFDANVESKIQLVDRHRENETKIKELQDFIEYKKMHLAGEGGETE